MEKNFYSIYQNLLEKDREINTTSEIQAEPYIISLLRAEIITVTEAELVNAETTNEAKNDKLFLEIMPAKGQNGINKLMVVLAENNVGEELINYLKELEEEDVHGKIFGNIPTPNLSFVGRQSIFDIVNENFGTASVKDESCNIVVLHGMAGVGKTEMAAEFIHKHKNNYNRVVWISVSNQDACFVELAKELNLRGQTTGQTIGQVKSWFEKSSPCLIVFDDADHFRQIEDYLPRFGCNILVTSRYANWPPFEVVVSINVKVFSVEESESFIGNLLASKVSLYAHDVYELGEILGRLPLATAQACCYIRESMCSISDYVKMFNDRKHETELLSAQKLPKDMQNEENENTIMITWNITKKAIRDRSPIASKLLSLCAYFQCDCISNFLAKIAFFLLHIDDLDSDMSPDIFIAMLYSLECHREYFIDFAKAMTILSNFSMLTSSMKRDQFSMHCLLQKVITLQIRNSTEDIRNIQCLTTLLTVAYEYPENNEVRKLKQSSFLAHVKWQMNTLNRCIDDSVEELKSFNNDVVLLKLVAAEVEFGMGLFEAAHTLFEDVLKRIINIGPKYPAVANVFEKLGVICFRIHDFKNAESYLEKAFDIFEKNVGNNKTRLYLPMHTLERLYRITGNTSKLNELVEKAIKMQVDHSAPGDLCEKANYMCHLGRMHAIHGDQDKAKDMFEQALSTYEKALLSSDQQKLFNGLFNFASTCDQLEDLNIQKDLIEKVLSIQIGHFGLSDADVSAIFSVLGRVYEKLGDFVKSKDVYEKVLSINENFFGQNHPIIIDNSINLARVLLQLCDSKRVVTLLEKALQLAEYNVPPIYRQIVVVMEHLLTAYEHLGESSKAEELLERNRQVYIAWNANDNKTNELYLDLIGQSNEKLTNCELKLNEKELTELKYLIERKQFFLEVNLFPAVHKLLKWPPNHFLPALGVFRIAILIDFVAGHFFEHESEVQYLMDMFCRYAAHSRKSTNEFRSIICAIFANSFASSSTARCSLAASANKVAETILSSCICTSAAAVQVTAAAALSNIAFFLTLETERFNGDEILIFAKRLFIGLTDMGAFGFQSFNTRCLLFFLQAVCVVLQSSGQAIDQLAKEHDVTEQVAKIRFQLFLKNNVDEYIKTFIDNVLTLLKMH